MARNKIFKVGTSWTSVHSGKDKRIAADMQPSMPRYHKCSKRADIGSLRRESQRNGPVKVWKPL